MDPATWIPLRQTVIKKEVTQTIVREQQTEVARVVPSGHWTHGKAYAANSEDLAGLPASTPARPRRDKKHRESKVLFSVRGQSANII